MIGSGGDARKVAHHDRLGSVRGRDGVASASVVPRVQHYAVTLLDLEPGRHPARPSDDQDPSYPGGFLELASGRPQAAISRGMAALRRENPRVERGHAASSQARRGRKQFSGRTEHDGPTGAHAVTIGMSSDQVS